MVESQYGVPIPFDLIGGHLALDLVNTVSWRLDPVRRRENLTDYPALIQWCHRAGALQGVTFSHVVEEMTEVGLEQPILLPVLKLREELHKSLRLCIRAMAADDGTVPNLASRQLPHAAESLTISLSLRRYIDQSLRHSRLVGMPMRWHLEVENPSDVVHLLALSALELLQSPQIELLRQCEGSGCGWFFLDRSRNRSRRWCSSNDCGNRDRARRFYVREQMKRNGTG